MSITNNEVGVADLPRATDRSLDDTRASLVRESLEVLRADEVNIDAARSVFVPGRIEFLGKHTDYAGGRSLLCAVERGICLTYASRTDNAVCIFHPATGGRTEFALKPDLCGTPGHWSNYPVTVARRVARNFPGPLRGANLVIQSNLPAAAGLSSSSALVVGIWSALADVNQLDRRPEYTAAIQTIEDLAEYLGTTENGQSYGKYGALLAGDHGVGTFGGSEDHTAILCSEPGNLRQYSFCPVRFEGSVPLPAGHTLVVGCSGITAQKTGSAKDAYNRISLAARELLRLWNLSTGRSDPSLAAAVHSNVAATERLGDIISDSEPGKFTSADLLNRLEQFVEESDRIIPAAAAALRAGDLPQLGRVVDESQALAERCLGNQVPQTAFLARSARELGAVAASAFGAGFGGSVWALVRDADVQGFRDAWLAGYRQAYPREGERALTFTTNASAGAGAATA